MKSARLGKDHWISKVQPLGHASIEVAYQRSFTAAETEKLRAGLWPQQMEDKWIVFLGQSSLDCWRSWTGHCIYSVLVRCFGDGVSVGPLLINADTQQYRSPGGEEDVRIFEAIIARFLSS